jgi:cytochrome bd ubiquinol oxidase subunit II
VIVSSVIGVLTLGLLWKNLFELARYSSGLAVGGLLAGWALAQRPDFLPGELSLRAAAADDPTLIATLVALVLGLLVIVPSIAVLFRLTLEGRLSERFRPIVTPDEPGDR